MSYDAELLAPLLPHARRGDAHAILGHPPGTDLRAELDDPPAWTTGSYEKLLALYIAGEYGDAAAISGVIYDFAEHTYFRHDDDGTCLAQLNTDLCRLFACELGDERKALDYLEAALVGPYPQGVRTELAPVLVQPVLRERLDRIVDQA